MGNDAKIGILTFITVIVVVTITLWFFNNSLPSTKMHQAGTDNCQRSYAVNINNQYRLFCRMVDSQGATDCIDQRWEFLDNQGPRGIFWW
jgi:ABC-type protease/lipase transport system fused ATPase/permease subunit